MGHVQARATGAILPFPDATARPARSLIGSDERRGQILLFTGVRYAAWPEPSPEPSPEISDTPRAGRRRRR